MELDLLTPENAPDGSAQLLAAVREQMGGFLPSLYRQMAHSPAILDAYLTLSKQLGKTGFSRAEQQLILLTASVRNGCVYCVAAHSSGARMAKLDKQAIEAIRSETAIDDPKLQALRLYVEAQMEHRGKAGDSAIADLVAAGYTALHAAEVLIGISMKALSNSFARMVGTPLEEVNARMAWDGNDRV